VWTRFAPLCVLLAFTWGCKAPAPSFPIPSGPPKEIALDVQLPVYVLGRWLVDGFSETLRLELVDYNIKVVDPKARPSTVAEIALGHFTYPQWQVIDVVIVSGANVVQAGHVRVTDLEMTTLDASAPLVAMLIARSIWTTALAAPDP
jgi:hypothetical protein